MQKKLYLIGVDALPLWLLRELCKEKGFEGFRRLMNERVIVDSESVLPPMTGPAWPTIYTGLSPEQHRIQDFFVLRSNYTPDIVFYDSEKIRPFWETLAERGHRCLVVTPATVVKLSKNENVDMISGFPLPPSQSPCIDTRVICLAAYRLVIRSVLHFTCTNSLLLSSPHHPPQQLRHSK